MSLASEGDVPYGPARPAAGAGRKRRSLLLIFGSAFVVLLATLGTGLYLSLGGRLALGASTPTDTVKILVASDGIVALSLGDLRAAGLSADRLSPDALRLTLRGADVPFLLQGDTLVFYGQAPRAPENIYTRENVYWLHTARGAGALIGERAAQVAAGMPAASGMGHAHFKENKVFQALAPEGSDAWVWAQVHAGTSITQSFDAPGAQGGEGTLYLQVLSITDTAQNPDHHLVVSVNGQVLGEDRWNGVEYRAITLTVPSGALRAQGNALTLNAPGDTGAAVEVNFLSGFDLDYVRALALEFPTVEWSPRPGERAFVLSGAAGDEPVVLDVSDPSAPVRLASVKSGQAFGDFAAVTRYAAGTVAGARGRSGVRLEGAQEPALQDQTAGADYLVVAPARFAEALAPLLQLRQGQGLRVRQVALEDVFDAYGGGMPLTAALRDFLRDTQTRWDVKPRYVLLVGDASYDYRDDLHAGNKSVLPTQLVYTGASGQTASDVWFTLTGDDGRPQFALGRLPAQNAEQVQLIVQKIIAYERAETGDWSRRVLLAADSEIEFQNVSDDLAAKILPADVQADKVYFGKDLPEAQAHTRIMDALNGGVAVANYVGHGSLDVWGDEKALQTSDVAALNNGDRLPIFVTYTCLNGFFHHPEATSLSETLLWRQGGGVVAALVPSGRSYTVYQRPLVDGFYQDLYAQASDARLGDALLQAQRSLSAGAGYEDVLLTFNLLGDPALRFIGTRR